MSRAFHPDRDRLASVVPWPAHQRRGVSVRLVRFLGLPKRPSNGTLESRSIKVPDHPSSCEARAKYAPLGDPRSNHVAVTRLLLLSEPPGEDTVVCQQGWLSGIRCSEYAEHGAPVEDATRRCVGGGSVSSHQKLPWQTPRVNAERCSAIALTIPMGSRKPIATFVLGRASCDTCLSCARSSRPLSAGETH